MRLVVAIPPNAASALISLTANADIDMYLQLHDGTCLAGYTGCATAVGSGAYEGTRYVFSGDDTSVPVSESIQLTSLSTVWTYFYVRGYQAGAATWAEEVSCV